VRDISYFSRRHHHPLGLLELADHADLAEGRRALDDLLHPGRRLGLHGVAAGLAVPVGDGDEGGGVVDLAVQLGAPCARRLLDQLAGADPGVGVVLGGMAVADMHFEDVLHGFLLSAVNRASRREGDDLPH